MSTKRIEIPRWKGKTAYYRAMGKSSYLEDQRAKCSNAQCDRTVSNAAIQYCCNGCAMEAESPIRYWPEHSERCNEPARARGEGGSGA